jgi:hypothetical protein
VGSKLLMLGDSQAEISTLAAIKDSVFGKLVKCTMFTFRFLSYLETAIIVPNGKL